MSWQIEGDRDRMLILDGARVVGSIARSAGNSHGWRVEILWSGSAGDLTYEAPTMASAQGFVHGVEMAWAAIRAEDD
ncbi:hypothetical protein [Bradyrhizobium sp. S3.7.6]